MAQRLVSDSVLDARERAANQRCTSRRRQRVGSTALALQRAQSASSERRERAVLMARRGAPHGFAGRGCRWAGLIRTEQPLLVGICWARNLVAQRVSKRPNAAPARGRACPQPRTEPGRHFAALHAPCQARALRGLRLRTGFARHTVEVALAQASQRAVLPSFLQNAVQGVENNGHFCSRRARERCDAARNTSHVARSKLNAPLQSHWGSLGARILAVRARCARPELQESAARAQARHAAAGPKRQTRPNRAQQPRAGAAGQRARQQVRT